MNIVTLLFHRRINKNSKLSKLLFEIQKEIIKEKRKLICNKKHIFGYAPVCEHGICRVCGKRERRTDRDIYSHIIANVCTTR